MITNAISFAPAWIPGTGSFVARPYACAAALPPLAEVQGTRLPMAGLKRHGADLVGIGFRALPTTQHDAITSTNNSTTPLGIHSPGRPKS